MDERPRRVGKEVSLLERHAQHVCQIWKTVPRHGRWHRVPSKDNSAVESALPTSFLRIPCVGRTIPLSPHAPRQNVEWRVWPHCDRTILAGTMRNHDVCSDDFGVVTSS
eukprot:6203046-Pleurochrysis_carterae.AAC.3